MTWDAQFEVAIRFADVLQDRSEYSEAENLMNSLLKSNNITHIQEVKALIKRGNAKIRASQEDPIQAGMDDFYRATQIASENNLADELGLAELEIGWVFSNGGKWAKANEQFAKALEIALKNGDKKLQAKAFNELAYIKFNDDPDTAILYGNSAIELWLEIGDKDGLARSYSTMGTIYYRTGEYENARDFFQKSLDIFEQANKIEWIARVSSWQGITYWAQGINAKNQSDTGKLFLKAENLLRRAIKLGVPQDVAQNANRLSRVYKAQGNLETAWKQLVEAYNASIDTSNTIYEVATIRDLSELALELKKLDFYEDLKHMLAEYKTRWTAENTLAYGGALINIGIIAVYQGESDFGFRTIAEGLKYSAESGKYASHDFSNTLKEFHNYAEKLIAPVERKDLADYLKRYWESENLSRKYLSATSLFYRL